LYSTKSTLLDELKIFFLEKKNTDFVGAFHFVVMCWRFSLESQRGRRSKV